ncbi:MAG: hypothetical protein HGB18_03420 [Candidatus Moranbacteria bacterium]|nr:hypothetical protein [Candidatus Moranbacteria bacterium]NTW46072.1 hypothetical protein [Candidatus Moranbacteria bacterium]
MTETQKSALLSVFHKDGIVEFARSLIDLGWTLYASGGTAKTLFAANIPVIDVATIVGGKAILGHRVVTLSREVHAGLLATETDADIAELEALGVPRIDLVCVDLYPLKQEITKPEIDRESVIEKTDIGGPTMLRSAAKGRRIVICDPNDRERVISWLRAGRPDEDALITELAAKTEFVVADYCLASAIYHGNGDYDGMMGRRVATFRYGENGYQTPAEQYAYDTGDPLALSRFTLIEGGGLSFNNGCDGDRLLQIVTHIAATFDVNRSYVPRIAIGVKHGNPCGVGIGMTAVDAIQKMVMGDPLAIFGGIIMVNFEIGKDEAVALLRHGMPDGKRRLIDGVFASAFSDEARDLLRRKEGKCNLLANPHLTRLNRDSLDTEPIRRPVRNGHLTQPNYTFILDLNDPDIVKYGVATREQEQAMLLAKAICDTSNSNTITLCTDRMLVGNGVGQQARVYAAELAVERAKKSGHQTEGSVAASDSFFPFEDGVEVLHAAGVTAIISTSASVNDQKVIDYCKKHNVVLYLIPDKKGRGFFNH